jgi:hypothetical protein
VAQPLRRHTRDYRVRIDKSLSQRGTIDNLPWRTPAAWLAVVRGGMVLEWRVFADNKPVYEILAKRHRAGA